MGPPQFESIDQVQAAILRLLLEDGESTSPRGLRTLESRAVSFTLLDPRQRCVLNPFRKWSLPLAIGELCWHLSGATMASDLAYYAPAWASFGDSEGRIRGSCYGSKVFSPAGGASPWFLAGELLRHDPGSRRAVLYFDDRTSHLALDCPDAACASNVQFLIRKGSLEAVVSMRSNDAIWGLPYDVFLFSLLQEMMAVRLGTGLGPYHHFVSSLHLYDRHQSVAARVVENPDSPRFAMPPLPVGGPPEEFLEYERGLRSGAPIAPPRMDSYWAELAQVLDLYRLSRSIGWFGALESGGSNRYLPVLRPLGLRPADTQDSNRRKPTAPAP